MADGFDLSALLRVVNDCQIVLSSRQIGATAITRNERELRLIQQVAPLSLVGVPWTRALRTPAVFPAAPSVPNTGLLVFMKLWQNPPGEESDPWRVRDLLANRTEEIPHGGRIQLKEWSKIR